jgi:hypothetical protein
MSGKSFGSLALFAVALIAGGCREGSLTASAEADRELQAALTAAADAAVEGGDADRAEALRHGTDALRWGIRPSVIEVKIRDNTARYAAIVVGLVRRGGEGEPVLVRHLVAWTGRPPTALLQVTSKSDQALFASTARGHWKDLVNRDVWVATAGSADLELAGTGDACPTQPPAAALRCDLASFDIRINGSFQLLMPVGPDGPPIAIQTSAAGVHGVVIKPAN